MSYTPGRPKSEFRRAADSRAIAWKKSTTLLPDDARAAAPYLGRHGSERPSILCLPAEYARLNVLPDARDAIEWFSAAAVRWHDGVGGGPSNHLLDSQVQCVNALAPLATKPEQLAAAFGDVLPITEVLPMPSGRFLEFEWIGDEDYLGEARGASRVRGALVTSADGAFRYRTPDGDVELALVEWKFTEDYRRLELDAPRGAPRQDRYRPLWDDADCPIRHEVIPYDDLFVEPVYQLFRQQLLAWRMTVAGEADARRVRVVHIAPSDNDGFLQSLNRESHRSVGGDVLTLWRQLLRHPDDFISVDSARFTERQREWCGSDYCARYGGDEK